MLQPDIRKTAIVTATVVALLNLFIVPPHFNN